MLARELIDRFADSGVRLSVENGQLAFEGPREVLTPERIEELRHHKAELLAALASPDPDAFEERSAIAEHDGGLPRRKAETLAAREQGFDDADSFHGEVVRRWAAEIDRLANLPAACPEGAEALKRAQAFITEGWVFQAARLGWDEIELFGVCPRAPWQRLDRKGVAFGGAVKAITRETVVYVGGLRRHRSTVNNDGGAVPIWELAQNSQTDGGNAA
jgi:hypothetical protein